MSALTPEILADAVEAVSERIAAVHVWTQYDTAFCKAEADKIFNRTASALARFRAAREGQAEPAPFSEPKPIPPPSHPYPPAPLDEAAWEKAADAYRAQVGSGPPEWNARALRAAITTYLREAGRGL